MAQRWIIAEKGTGTWDRKRWTLATTLTFSHLSCSIIISFRKADHPIRDRKEGQAELLLLATVAADTYMPEHFAK